MRAWACAMMCLGIEGKGEDDGGGFTCRLFLCGDRMLFRSVDRSPLFVTRFGERACRRVRGSWYG